jgi:hypothetical protein
MTFIKQQPNDTRAKRSFEPRFRHDGGAYPVDHRGTFTSNRTHEGIRATIMNRDFSRAHPCKLRLLFPLDISSLERP